MTSRVPPPSNSDMEAAAFGHVRGRRRSGGGLPKYHTIKGWPKLSMFHLARLGAGSRTGT